MQSRKSKFYNEAKVVVNHGSRLLILVVAFLLCLFEPFSAIAGEKISFVRDAETEEYIKNLASPILKAAKIDERSVRIVLVEKDSINAFVAGGMNLFIHTGLLEKADTPEQLIGVLAHEIGHIAGGHIVRAQTAMRQASAEALLATILGAVAAASTKGNAGAGTAIMVGGQEMARRSLLSFTRTQEAAADQAALSFLDKSGITSQGMVEFLEKLADQDILPYDQQEEFVRTHPLTANRIQAIRNHIDEGNQAALSPPLHETHKRMRAKLMGFLRPQRALQKFPTKNIEDPASLYARATALFRQGHTDEALEIMDKLLAAEPNNPFFNELRGQILFEGGRAVESITPYEKAVKLLPSSALLRLALAHSYIESGDNRNLPKAIASLKESLRIEPTLSMSWRFLATAWGRMNNDGMAAYAMAEEAVTRGDKKEATTYANRALKKLPTGSAGWLRAKDIIAINGDAS